MIGRFVLGCNKRTWLEITNTKSNSPEPSYPWITFCFVTPHLNFFKYKKNDYAEWYRTLGLDCPTRFLVHNTEGFWSLNFALLGFGFYISYQDGY